MTFSTEKYGESICCSLSLKKFSCKIAKYVKVLISIFQQSFASINKIFILGGALGARLKFCEVLGFS